MNRKAVRNLNAGEVFTTSNSDTKYVCTRVAGGFGEPCVVDYTVLGDNYPMRYTAAGLSTVTVYA